MRTKIVKIGNSKGVRIPKALLDQSNIGERVRLEAVNGQITIKPDMDYEEMSGRELAIMSESALSDWNDPREDEAWKDL